MKTNLPIKFKKEWEKLTEKGILSSIPHGPGVIKVKWIWQEDKMPNIDVISFELTNYTFENNLKKILDNCNWNDFFGDTIIEHISSVAYKSNEYKNVINRIEKFCQETEEYGLKHYGDKDALWEEYFWDWDNIKDKLCEGCKNMVQ